MLSQFLLILVFSMQLKIANDWARTVDLCSRRHQQILEQHSFALLIQSSLIECSSQVTYFNQSECFISVQHSYATYNLFMTMDPGVRNDRSGHCNTEFCYPYVTMILYITFRFGSTAPTLILDCSYVSLTSFQDSFRMTSTRMSRRPPSPAFWGRKRRRRSEGIERSSPRSSWRNWRGLSRRHTTQMSTPGRCYHSKQICRRTEYRLVCIGIRALQQQEALNSVLSSYGLK